MTKSEKPDISAIMAEIRSRVASDVKTHKDKRMPLKAYDADSDGHAQRKAGELVHSEELRYLNVNHAYSINTLSLDSITSHRPGIFGKLIVKIKRKLLGLIWDKLLKDYFHAEKEFQSHLVRYLNDSSKYVDARDASNFWELIRKIDYDVTKAMDRIEKIADEQSGSLVSTEKRLREAFDSTARDLNERITQIQGTVERWEERITRIESAVGGLEGLLARLGASTSEKRASEDPGAQKVTKVLEVPDYSYVLLENRFRGSEDEIRSRLKMYVEIFSGVKQQVLEIGPGRGELQLLFKDKGIPSYGIDIDDGMVQECKARGLDVRKDDIFSHLQGLPDESLGGVIAIQVLEHLSNEQIKLLLRSCYSKLTKGAKVVFETVNPKSLLALSSNYFRDPTHVFPLHPDTLAFQITLSGLKVLETRPLSPVPNEALLREIPSEDYMTPRWVQTVDRFNQNIKQLNELLYGYQDYCIIAEKK